MVKIIAHRGASVEAPENTLSAFKRAVELRVDAIECDVRLSKDGIPVVIHDHTLERTTNCKKPFLIEDLSLKDIKALDAGSWHHPRYRSETIPTLDELLAFNTHGCPLMIEIKEGTYLPQKVVTEVLALIKKHRTSAIIGSFDIKIIQEVQKQSPETSVTGIIESPEELPKFQSLAVNQMTVWYPLLNPSLVDSLHEENMEIWAFTVDDVKKAEFLTAIGVDGIISNDPELLQNSPYLL